LEDGITIGGKTLREQNEVINHKILLKMLYDFIEKDRDISEELILNIHKEVLRNIDDENA